MSGNLDIVAANNGISRDDGLRAKFMEWAEEKYAQEFIDCLMDNAKVIANKVNDLPNPFRNGRKGAEYFVEFALPDYIKAPKFVGLEAVGLTCHRSEADASLYVISGTPLVDGDQEVILNYYHDGWIEGMPPLKRTFRFAVNPDPRDLWKDLPVPEDIEYPKPDTDSIYVKVDAGADGKPRKNMVAASRRGRSHAHEGKPRDDHFKLCHCQKSGWHILAVADGAGSAAFSREGSRIACDVAVDFCESKLKLPDNELDEAIASVIQHPLKPDLLQSLRSICEKCAYGIIANGALQANKAIREAAEAKSRFPKEYATTLLLVVCKRFFIGWVVLAFNVGDGAIGIVYEHGNIFKSRLVCTPDEGEFGGQTRFITMNEIFKNYDEIMNRIHTAFIKDFDAIMLMTDGVSDAVFETSANLRDSQKWKDLWTDITSHVHLENNNENSEKELLEWLTFWSPGNHDDRTIAVLS